MHRISSTLSHLNRHRRGGGVVLLESPRTEVVESWRYSQARWQESEFRDPWPVRG
jgi:hypothetical protein